MAAQLQAEKAAAAEATEVARHGACVLRQPDEPPAVEMGSHLEVLVLIEEPEEDGSSSKEYSKEYSQWVAVVFAAAADGTAAHKKPTATGQMRKVNIGWFLLLYEDDGVGEWLRLPGGAFNNNARGSWRVDLDFGDFVAVSRAAGAAAVTSADAATAAVAVTAMNPRTRAATQASPAIIELEVVHCQVMTSVLSSLRLSPHITSASLHAASHVSLLIR